MRELLNFLLENLLPADSKYEVEESQEDQTTKFLIKCEPSIIGLVIGKNGKTIRNLRNLLRVRATLDQKGVYLGVEEK